ncbi:transporter substrate-binding domain-containing protein [Alteribacillus bidgolensis]|uniref:Amino acid ABC transporter substrate-binding protein, PAAT family n=1 Tax=Alteribacillus bidgolensis TaxID=930129 RepID=A0A1G8N0C5_9BACI|nr:transporter substrate-binding domain-containing protein [Alteribacillus bidgolensis]SDI73603.1 amino acid ABC transporter substrate-binding protein, PAAT family [Alteribacillus bidgolensis]
MKKFFMFSLLAMFLFIIAACGAENNLEEETAGEEEAAEETENGAGNEEEAEEAAEDEEKPTYSVATDNNYVPFEFIDQETDKLIGFDIDLINAIADEAGFDIEIEQMEFSGIVSAIPSGRFDIGIAGMTITEEREENIDFSQPYYDAGLILAVLDGNEEISSIDDVDGMTVATRVGSTSEDYLQENTDANVEAFPEITEAYRSVLTERTDAVLYDKPNVEYYAETEAGGELVTVGDLLQGEQYGIAFPKDSELRDEVDEAIDSLKESGKFDEIYTKWFGEAPDDSEEE